MAYGKKPSGKLGGGTKVETTRPKAVAGAREGGTSDGGPRAGKGKPVGKHAIPKLGGASRGKLNLGTSKATAPMSRGKG